jgi:hypothetical protein
MARRRSDVAVPVLLALFFVSGCGGKSRTAREAITQLAGLMESDFVYPEIGRQYAAELRRKLAAGAYSRLSNEREIAEAVTADLQRIHPDGHLKLMAPGRAPRAASDANRPAATGLGKTEWLTPGVAYMSLHGFTGADDELSRLGNALERVASATTLIVDARDYVGGSPLEGDLMFSYFFEKPTRLLWMDVRRSVDERGGNPMTDGKTLKRIAGPDGMVRREWIAVPSERPMALKRAAIFVLTSKATASAGEGFALALKRTQRATLIGETTAGAGHFGRTVTLAGGYRAFIPVGRPFDPDTGEGWEQTGVGPHMAVPADRALEVALRSAMLR